MGRASESETRTLTTKKKKTEERGTTIPDVVVWRKFGRRVEEGGRNTGYLSFCAVTTVYDEDEVFRVIYAPDDRYARSIFRTRLYVATMMEP